jgi:hypothetical protein
VVDNDGPHAARERTGAIALSRGLHPLRVLYFQAGGASALKLEWQGPHQPREVVPDDRLVRNR